MNVQQMRTLLNDRDEKEVLDRLSRVRPDSQRRWGSMSAHQMICHLSDSFRVALGEKHVRLLNEEKVLLQELPGYSEYCLQTRFRLVPFFW
jgi:hypothetical protein